jgi:hypothetical protein
MPQYLVWLCWAIGLSRSLVGSSGSPELGELVGDAIEFE